MAQLLGPHAADATAIGFELDSFDRGRDDRLEVSGRWFGVRGRRFMRPVLTLSADGSRCRLLADLEHKPWAPDEGALWIAAFPFELADADISDLELCVAPDIVIVLPPPGVDAGRLLGPQSDEAIPLFKHDPLDAEALSRRLADERRKNERLRAELERAERAKVEATAARSRRDSAVAALEAAEAEREAAVRARIEAHEQRDQAVAALRRARREHQAASAALTAERAAALEALRRAQAEAHEAKRQLRNVSGQRDRAVAAASERERAVAIASERASAVASEREPVLAPTSERKAAYAAPERKAQRPPRAISRRHQAHWPHRVFALIVLLAVLVVLGLIVHVL